MYIRLEKSFNDYLRISYEGNGMWYYRWNGYVPENNINTWTMIDVVLAFLKWRALEKVFVYSTMSRVGCIYSLNKPGNRDKVLSSLRRAN